MTSARGVVFASYCPLILMAAALAATAAAPAFAAPPQDPFGEGSGGASHADDNPFGAPDDPFGDGRENPFSRDPQPSQRSRGERRAPDQSSRTREAERQRRPGADQRIVWAEPDARRNSRVRAALERPLPSVGLDFTQTPLEEVAAFLRDEYQIEIQLDVAALEDIGVGPDDAVTVNLRNLSLRSALRHMLDALYLEYVVTNGMLLITSQEDAETHLKVAVYPVSDLVSAGGPHEDFDSLIDTIISTVASETWAENGGGEAELRPMPPGRLVVSQTERVHEQIAAVLEALRRAAGRGQGQAAASAAPAGAYTRAYELAIPANTDPERFTAQLMSLVRQVAPESTRSGEGDAHVLAALADRVVVHNRREAHQQIESLLKDLKLLRPAAPRGGFRGGGLGGGGFGGGGGGAF